ncbi:hypothetical protein LX16_0433 [Stackebrandtia albiflava]|uniref:Uncharacterized protein n=1 Tax=Stackebrandtia albiflava TaxID=406432 RepID=A0A562VA49_9ACTN|nr:hypothetical protein [Stackebrandtia albiflava]TWJ14744.1 hypothetical protein LX16_0433 [Stackebrandtia albiflava]
MLDITVAVAVASLVVLAFPLLHHRLAAVPAPPSGDCPAGSGGCRHTMAVTVTVRRPRDGVAVSHRVCDCGAIRLAVAVGLPSVFGGGQPVAGAGAVSFGGGRSDR